jgi:5-methylcytosine-specific restriction endonuclease McrA
VTTRAARTLVIERAQERCEYCLRHQEDSPLARLQVEHIIPRKHRGSEETDNLAAACIDCNLRKGTNLTGLDPDTGAITPLFDPRRQAWTEHFAWDGLFMVGLTAVGRTTVRVLELNSNDRIEVRLWSVRPSG